MVVSSEFTVNLGDYNSKKFGGSYGGKFSAEHDTTALAEHLYDKLYESINDEILIAQELAPRGSFIHTVVTQ